MPSARRAQPRQAQALLRAHVAHVVGDQAEGPHQPDRHDQRQQQHRQPPRPAPTYKVLRARGLDELAEALHRLAHAHHADDLVVPAHRRADVHHRGRRVVLDVARGARAVLARERQADVAPAARSRRPSTWPSESNSTRPLAVGDVQPQLDAGLVQAEDLRFEAGARTPSGTAAPAARCRWRRRCTSCSTRLAISCAVSTSDSSADSR